MKNAGKWVIVAMLSIAIVAVGLSTWYHYQGQHRAQDFWSTTSAVLIAEGQHVRALQLTDTPYDSSTEEANTSEALAKPAVEFGGFAWDVLASKDAEKARGIGNIRRALVLDTTFDWKAADPGEPTWQYALEFNDDKNWATVLFDFDSRQVALTGGKRSAVLDPAAANDWREFFGEQFDQEPAAEPGDKPADKPSDQPTDKPTDKPEEPAADKPAEKPADAPEDKPADQPPASAARSPHRKVG